MIPLRLVEIDLFKALEISDKFNIYAYDAYFLECAKNYNSPLLTLDKRLMEVARLTKLNIIKV